MNRLPHALRHLASAVLGAGVLAVSCVLPAQAANNGSWSVEPTSPPGAIARQYLVYNVPAGQLVKDSVTVTNLLDVSQSFKIYGADGYTTEHDGGLGLKKLDEPQDAVGSWITTSRTDLTLKPHQAVKIPFAIKVPAGATPGDYAGAVVALNTEIQPGGGGTGPNIGIQRAVATRVYLRVQGPATAGVAVERVWIERDRLDRDHPLRGGQHWQRPPGAHQLDPPHRRLRSRAATLEPLDLGTLLPGARSEYQQVTDALPVVDHVTATVAVSAPEATASASTTLLLLPWWVVAGQPWSCCSCWWVWSSAQPTSPTAARAAGTGVRRPRDRDGMIPHPAPRRPVGWRHLLMLAGVAAACRPARGAGRQRFRGRGGCGRSSSRRRQAGCTTIKDHRRGLARQRPAPDDDLRQPRPRWLAEL